jgi:hypothetical protein
LGDERPEVRRRIRPLDFDGGRLTVEDLVEDRGLAVAAKRQLARQHLVEHNA